MKKIDYVTNGICARRIQVLLDDEDKIVDLSFDGGCDGNHKGIRALCIGRKADEVAELLAGIRCGFRPTSCPDQLSKALKSR